MPSFRAFQPRRALFATLALTAFAACAPIEARTAEPAAPAPASVPAAELEPLAVVTAAGPVRFQVEVADDDRERARGLMYRASLADDRGMLFVYQQAQPASFWMRNTWISLDIIFIAPNGRILNIAENTTPYSEAPIPSAGVVRGVLEIRGGLARELGIEPGDKVDHPVFPRD